MSPVEEADRFRPFLPRQEPIVNVSGARLPICNDEIVARTIRGEH
jgi:hypothetical protein